MVHRLSRFMAALVVALLALAAPVAAQTTFSSTTLSAPGIALGDTQFTVASTTGMDRNHVIVIDREAMRVQEALTSTVVRVARGTDGTAAGTHSATARVYFGTANRFGPLEKLATAMVIRSADFNIDNGVGVTQDSIIVLNRPAHVWGCSIIYGETAGAVAAGNVRIGTTIGAQDVVALDAYTNSAAAGTIEPLALLKTALTGNLYIRHTGVVATPILGIATVQCSVAFD